MERKKIIDGIFESHYDAGLFFSPDYKRLSPSYGVDNPVMKFRGCSASVDDIVEILENETDFSVEKLISAFKIAVRPSYLLKVHRAEFENACDDLYYGYGFAFWRSHNNGIADDDEAKIVWKAAVNKMANS